MKKYIHYFIDKIENLNGLRKSCLDTWKKNLPEEYQIKIWSLKDIEKIDDEVAKEIIGLKNYNIQKNYIEVYAMYTYGGIFVDQNIELCKDISDLIDENETFLAMDEKHVISPSIWYEKKPKSYLSTNVYNLFKKNISEGIYNNCFLELSLIFKEILVDFDPSNNKTQNLKNKVTIYSSDYFYPYSYDGHTKNNTKNTRAINYFHYDFITKKGKLKNIIYSVFGYKIAKKIFALFQLFKKVLRFILLPILKYRRKKKKNTVKHRNLFNKTLEQIPKYKNKEYIAFHNPEWTGVSNATIELFANSIPCGELINKKEVRTIANEILDNNIKEVVFSGFCIGWKDLAKILHRKKVIVKTYFHGSHSQYIDEYGWEMNKQIYLLEKKGIVSEMAFCKESIINFYKDKGCNVTFLRNLVNIEYDIKKKVKKENEFRVGVYAVQTTQWRKNVFTSLASIYYLKEQIKDKEIVIDIVPKSSSAETFCHILGIKTDGVEKAIPREQLLQRMSECDITLYVTFSECAPMVPLESFNVGTPCITGNNHHYFKNSELEKYIVVNNENNPMEVSEKILKCVNNKDKVFALYSKFSENNLLEGKKLVKDYLAVRGCENEKL